MAKRAEIVGGVHPGDAVRHRGSGQGTDTPDFDSGNASGNAVPVVTMVRKRPHLSTLDHAAVQALGRAGGVAAHAKKFKSQRAHEFTGPEARRAGKKGGAALVAKFGREHMRLLAIKGGAGMRNRVTHITIERDA